MVNLEDRRNGSALKFPDTFVLDEAIVNTLLNRLFRMQ